MSLSQLQDGDIFHLAIFRPNRENLLGWDIDEIYLKFWNLDAPPVADSVNLAISRNA